MEEKEDQEMELSPGKDSWPELVGYSGRLAADIVERENTNVQAIIVLDGTPATLDYRCDRVRVWVDRSSTVVRPPQVG